MTSQRLNPSASVFRALLCFFFLLMLTIPTTFQIERGLLLALLTLCAIVFYMNAQKSYIHPVVAVWAFVSITCSLSFMLIGVIRNAPGALAVATVFVVWPILFIFFIGLTKNSAAYGMLLKTILVGSIIASLMGIFLILDALFGLGFGIAQVFEKQGAAIGLYKGTIEYRLFNITTVIYGAPFVVAVLMLPKNHFLSSGHWRTACWIALFLCMFSVLISGRRALLLVVISSPFIALFLAKISNAPIIFSRQTLKVGLVCAIIGTIALRNLDIDFVAVIENFVTGFDFASDHSASLRSEQFWALISGWSEHPLFGGGLGAASRDIIRSDEQPWAYELSYVALLFQVGVLGFTIYAAAVFWIYYMGVRCMRSNPDAAGYLLPTLTGLSCFLIANATNPYLAKFDYLWVLFLPIGIVNAFMVSKRI